MINTLNSSSGDIPLCKRPKTEERDVLFLNIPGSSQTETAGPTDLSKNYWWREITKTQEFDEFKKSWKNLTTTEEARVKEAQKLHSSYKPSEYTASTNRSTYSAPLGFVYNIPGNFSMWMPGVALVAAYLAEKKQVKGLYVCETLEALSTKISEINLNPKNQRYACVVGAFQSGFNKQFPNFFEPNFPQHKVTVCLEKKDGQLTIAVLDAEPLPRFNKEILPENLVGQLWRGYDQKSQFNNQELVFRAILIACRNSNCQARLLHSHVLRQLSYGCEVFALQDAVAFLRDPDFFNRITCSKEKTVKIDQQYEIEVITTLPAEYMIGSQSSTIIDEYRQQGGQFDKPLLGKEKTLQNYLDANLIEVPTTNGTQKKQNHYITKKSFKYLNLVTLFLKYLKSSDIEKIISKILIE